MVTTLKGKMVTKNITTEAKILCLIFPLASSAKSYHFWTQILLNLFIKIEYITQYFSNLHIEEWSW